MRFDLRFPKVDGRQCFRNGGRSQDGSCKWDTLRIQSVKKTAELDTMIQDLQLSLNQTLMLSSRRVQESSEFKYAVKVKKELEEINQ